MAFTGFKVLTSSNFDKEIIAVHFIAKNVFVEAHLQITIKQGFLGKDLKFHKGQLKEVEIVHEDQSSSDTGQRIKNAAIGAVLLGPIGLVGAAFGGAKSLLKVRVITNQDQQLLLEMSPKDCEKILKELMDVDIQKVLNEQYLKK